MKLLLGEQRISLDDKGTTTILYKSKSKEIIPNNKNILVYVNPDEVLSVTVSED